MREPLPLINQNWDISAYQTIRIGPECGLLARVVETMHCDSAPACSLGLSDGFRTLEGNRREPGQEFAKLPVDNARLVLHGREHYQMDGL